MNTATDAANQEIINPATGAESQVDNILATPAAEVNTGAEKTYTQKEFDAHLGKQRKALAHEYAKKIGLPALDDDNIAKIKAIIEQNQTEEEKRAAELTRISEENQAKQRSIEEMEAILSAFEISTGKSKAEFEMLVKMARGLSGEEMTMQEAMQKVFEMTQSSNSNGNSNGVMGRDMTRPANQQTGITNPWDKNNWDIQAQFKLLTENPAQAKIFQEAAGFKLQLK